MLTSAFILLVIAIVSGYLGYKEIYPSSIRNAKVIFFISAILFLVVLIAYFLSPGPPPPAVPQNPLLS